MKKLNLLFMALICLLSVVVVAHAAVIDKIVVVVNSEVITQGEIDRLLGPLYQQFKTALPEDQLIKKLDEARQAIMGQLIEEKLILSEAKKQNIEIEEKEINAKVDDARKRFPSILMFEQALAAQRISLKELRLKYKEQLMTRKIIDQKVGARIIITPSDIAQYYANNMDKFSQADELKVSNILIKPKDNVAAQKTMDLVNEIDKRLKAGGDFAELAKVYSEGPGAKEGGLMGYVKQGDLLPEIEKVVFAMKQGEISGMIQTSLGYHFFKVDERKEARSLSLAEARRSIEEVLWQERIKEKSKGWIEDLRKHAYIAFK